MECREEIYLAWKKAKLCRMSSTQRVLWIALIRIADTLQELGEPIDQFRAGLNVVAEEAGLSETTVQKGIEELEKLRILRYTGGSFQIEWISERTACRTADRQTAERSLTGEDCSPALREPSFEAGSSAPVKEEQVSVRSTHVNANEGRIGNLQEKLADSQTSLEEKNQFLREIEDLVNISVSSRQSEEQIDQETKETEEKEETEDCCTVTARLTGRAPEDVTKKQERMQKDIREDILPLDIAELEEIRNLCNSEEDAGPAFPDKVPRKNPEVPSGSDAGEGNRTSAETEECSMILRQIAEPDRSGDKEGTGDTIPDAEPGKEPENIPGSEESVGKMSERFPEDFQRSGQDGEEIWTGDAEDAVVTAVLVTALENDGPVTQKHLENVTRILGQMLENRENCRNLEKQMGVLVHVPDWLRKVLKKLPEGFPKDFRKISEIFPQNFRNFSEELLRAWENPSCVRDMAQNALARAYSYLTIPTFPVYVTNSLTKYSVSESVPYTHIATNSLKGSDRPAQSIFGSGEKGTAAGEAGGPETEPAASLPVLPEVPREELQGNGREAADAKQCRWDSSQSVQGSAELRARDATGRKAGIQGPDRPVSLPAPVEGSAQALQDSAREVAEFERCWWQCSGKRATYRDVEWYLERSACYGTREVISVIEEVGDRDSAKVTKPYITRILKDRRANGGRDLFITGRNIGGVVNGRAVNERGQEIL